MSLGHKVKLCLTLGFLCLSLVLPGLGELFKAEPHLSGRVPEHLDALNQLRAYNGMMVAVGLIAGVAMFNLERNRRLILALATIMLTVAISRTLSLFLDGVPGSFTLGYMLVEFLIAIMLLVFLPPKAS